MKPDVTQSAMLMSTTCPLRANATRRDGRSCSGGQVTVTTLFLFQQL